MLGVRDDVVDGRDAQRELAEERDAADRLELADLLDLVLERDDVDRLGRGLEVADRLEHDLVLVVVEVADLERLELQQHLVAQDDAAEDRRLGVEVVRQDSTVAAHSRRRYNSASDTPDTRTPPSHRCATTA